ncbi:MAG: M50 family peptidase [Winogradskyella sp.]|uniref:M50 family metallopeptidase n=1 Tax=Winogradskyella sp. TaxID=1883156 RepID=UPI000F40FA26|nr:M50 family metallopeptidase [Winogradskyella sp.]RNC87618.1 MAG: M50 family peptidase [Winogradskyella sp.]
MAKDYQIDYKSIFAFILASVILVLVWRTYYGYYILYPFTILGTWFHEMGHGIMSMVVGGSFNKLEIFSNGSGLAHSSYFDSDFYFNKNIALGLVSASGLFGPPIIGSILIIMSKTEKRSKIMLYLLSIVMLISVIIWVRTTVGIVVIISLGSILLYVAIKGNETLQQLVVQFLGVIAIIDTYKQIDYLYTKSFISNGVEKLSDTGAMAERIGLTYNFWATVILILSFTLLLYSLYIRSKKRPAH